jgi:hypothetical protein
MLESSKKKSSKKKLTGLSPQKKSSKKKLTGLKLFLPRTAPVQCAVQQYKADKDKSRISNEQVTLP